MSTAVIVFTKFATSVNQSGQVKPWARRVPESESGVKKQSNGYNLLLFGMAGKWGVKQLENSWVTAGK